jgi:hypothetical protein
MLMGWPLRWRPGSQARQYNCRTNGDVSPFFAWVAALRVNGDHSAKSGDRLPHSKR